LGNRPIEYASWPIVGLTGSILRLMRGQPLTRNIIEADQSRSDVWTVTEDLYLTWHAITGGGVGPGKQDQQEDSQ